MSEPTVVEGLAPALKGAGGGAGVLGLVAWLLRWIPGTVANTKDEVGKIKVTLHGDGQTGEGLVGRLSRLERLHDEDETKVELASLKATVAGLVLAVDGFSGKLDAAIRARGKE